MTVPPVIGLVGAIGAGKSTAAAAFARRGGAVVDADRIGHDALEQPAIKARVTARWGDRILRIDGTVDRRAVGRIVFQNPDERRALEAIVYPDIERVCRDVIAEAQSNPAVPFVVLDAAVMLEAKWTGVCDRLVYIDAPLVLRQSRVLARSGWSPADLAAREAAQMPAAEKRSRADAIIINDGSAAKLDTAIDQLLIDWQLLATD